MPERPNVGAALKSIRKMKSLSLDKVAKLTGVSKAMLGQIERGESSPTIATVWKLATGLEHSFSSLVGANDKLTLGGDSSDPKMFVKTLFPFDAYTGVEIMDIKLIQFHEQRSSAHQAGVLEHIYVREGKLGVLDGDKWVELDAGESYKLSADKDHGYRDLSGATLFTDVIYYPHKAEN